MARQRHVHQRGGGWNQHHRVRLQPGRGRHVFFAATAVDTFGLESDYSTEVSALVPIKLTNQPPTLNALANVTINENASLQTVNLSGITSGATNESQTLTVTASSAIRG